MSLDILRAQIRRVLCRHQYRREEPGDCNTCRHRASCDAQLEETIAYTGLENPDSGR